VTDLKELFETAVSESKQLASRPDNQTLLNLYSLYKQGTEGDATGDSPGMFDMVGRAKFDAWSKLKGVSAEDAMQRYIDLVAGLKG